MSQPSTNLAVITGGTVVMTAFSEERKLLIRQQCAANATDAEFLFFLEQCYRLNADPLLKQIYFMRRGGKMSIELGIDGYRAVADGSSEYAGSDAPIYTGAGTLGNGKHHPKLCALTVYRMVQGERRAFTGSAAWQDFYTAGNAQWDKMPYRMLAVRAETEALKKAFPSLLRGTYTPDEMADAYEHSAKGKGVEVETSQVVSTPVEVKRLPPANVDLETGEIIETSVAPDTYAAPPESRAESVVSTEADEVPPAPELLPENEREEGAEDKFRRLKDAQDYFYKAARTLLIPYPSSAQEYNAWYSTLIGKKTSVNKLVEKDWFAMARGMTSYAGVCEGSTLRDWFSLKWITKFARGFDTTIETVYDISGEIWIKIAESAEEAIKEENAKEGVESDE